MRAASRTLRRLARDRPLLRVVASYASFSVTEYAVWIGVLVYAYDRGGSTAAGIVAFLELLPAAAVAPFVSVAADRRSPSRVLALGYFLQAVACTGLALAALTGASADLVYALAIVACTAVSTTRPSIAALVPGLTRDADGLTAANVALGWAESLAVVVAGAGTGLVLAQSEVGVVFAAAAVLLVVSAVLVAPLHAPPMGSGEDFSGVVDDIRRGVAEVGANPDAASLVRFLSAEFVVLGALDVLFVVIALGVLDAGEQWAGYFNMVFGVGGVVFGALAVLLIGHRLGRYVAASAVVLGAALCLTVLADTTFGVAALLAVVGGARTLFDVCIRTLLQRTVPAQLVARIFGLAEGASMAGTAAGALLVPVLLAIGGNRFAVVGVAALLPVTVLAGQATLRRLDRGGLVPVVEIALLRGVPLFRDLPAPSLEGLARALRRVEKRPGEVIIRAGDVGEDYYAIADGEVEVLADHRSRTLGRGEGIGEIALLRRVPRTATVVARTPVTLYALDRVSFLAAVNAHVPTQRAAEEIAAARAGR